MLHRCRPLCAFGLAAATLLSAASEAQAQAPPSLTLSVTTPYGSNQVIYGGSATYRVSAPTPPWQASGQVIYHYRQMDTVRGGPSDWFDVPGGLSLSFLEKTPGTFQVKATVQLATQQNQANPNPQRVPVDTAILPVTVAPPDGVTLPGPATANWNDLGMRNGMRVFKTTPVTFGFPVTCTRFTPTALPRATLLEDIFDVITLEKRDITQSKFNVPITHGGISGVTLMDQKSITIGEKNINLTRFNPGNRNSFPPGFVFTAYKQTLKLQIPDVNGDPRIFRLGPTFTVTHSSSAGGATPTTITVK